MIKSAAEIALMARAGALLAQVFDALGRLRLEGRSTLEINDLVERMIVDDLHARPASKGQYGYGFVLNSSRNQVVCHGVPSKDEILRDGDIVNLDITLEKDGFIADSSKTYLVGAVPAAARRLARTPVQMALGAAAIGAVAVLLGLLASLHSDLPSGPAMVVAAALLFLLLRVLPQRG